jgi:CBS domain-containing protein
MDEARTTTDKLVRSVMSASPVTAGPDTTVREAARLLADADVGALPVVTDGKLVGIVTDRDLVVRVLAAGRDLETPIGEIASSDLCTVTPDTPLEEAARLLGEAQVRRLPVVSEDGRLVGIVTQADLARNADHELTGTAVARISVPGRAALAGRDRALADSYPASDPPSGSAGVGGLRRG